MSCVTFGCRRLAGLEKILAKACRVLSWLSLTHVMMDMGSFVCSASINCLAKSMMWSVHVLLGHNLLSGKKQLC